MKDNQLIHRETTKRRREKRKTKLNKVKFQMLKQAQ